MRKQFCHGQLGGTPKMVLQNVDSGVAISPDSTKLAFVRGGGPGHTGLLVANSDGTGERVIGTGDFQFYVPPSWSLDGKLIATPATIRETSGIFIYSVAESHAVILPFSKSAVYSASWLPDGRALLITAAAPFQQRQIWEQPYPTGEARRLTNDTNDYVHVTISADGKQFTAVQNQRSNTIFVSSSSQANAGTPITTTKSDGMGLAWMPDGKLLSQDSNSRFWLWDEDGKSRTLAFDGNEFLAPSEVLVPGVFSICEHSSFVLLTRARAHWDRVGIWRVDVTGRSVQRLFANEEFAWFPDCSPDGSSFLYSSTSGNISRLMRTPTSGGSPEKLLEKAVIVARYAHDGGQIAALTDSGNGVVQFVLIDSRTGRITRTQQIPASLPDFVTQWILRWTPDGRAVTFPLAQADINNIWMLPLSGGSLHQITHFTDPVIAYDWSPDGKRLAVTRQSSSRDVVLFRNIH